MSVSPVRSVPMSFVELTFCELPLTHNSELIEPQNPTHNDFG
jgi:hypothetical protein